MQSGEALSAIGALDYSKEERRRLAKLYVISKQGLARWADSGGQVEGMEMPELRAAESRIDARQDWFVICRKWRERGRAT